MRRRSIIVSAATAALVSGGLVCLVVVQGGRGGGEPSAIGRIGGDAGSDRTTAKSAPLTRGRMRGRLNSAGTGPGCDEYGLGYGSGTCTCVASAVEYCLDGICICVCKAGYIQANTPEAGVSQCIPAPQGVSIVNDYSNQATATVAYCPPSPAFSPCVFTDAATYVNDIAGHAIFVPIKALLPDAGGTGPSTSA